MLAKESWIFIAKGPDHCVSNLESPFYLQTQWQHRTWHINSQRAMSPRPRRQRPRKKSRERDDKQQQNRDYQRWPKTIGGSRQKSKIRGFLCQQRIGQGTPSTMCRVPLRRRRKLVWPQGRWPSTWQRRTAAAWTTDGSGTRSTTSCPC